MKILDCLIATETMAERAWRYGESGVTHWKAGYLTLFADSSIMRPDGVTTRHDWHRQIPDDCLYGGRAP